MFGEDLPQASLGEVGRLEHKGAAPHSQVPSPGSSAEARDPEGQGLERMGPGAGHTCCR